MLCTCKSSNVFKLELLKQWNNLNLINKPWLWTALWIYEQNICLLFPIFAKWCSLVIADIPNPSHIFHNNVVDRATFA